jgi:hypothetical protein
MKPQASDTLYLNARPRQAKWVKSEALSNDCIRLKHQRKRHMLDLNQSSQHIWRLCDGNQTIQQLLDLFTNTYPGHANIQQDVEDTIKRLNDNDFLVFDGGDCALEFLGEVVRLFTCNDRLESELETIRTFLFTELKMMQAETLDADFEQLLGEEGLANAMALDADSAASVNDSRVISYGRAMELPTIANSIAIITKELAQQLPEIDSAIEVSGNAVYLKGSHMGWHSNHSRSDGRIYCTWSEKANSNFFRYQHPISGEIITEWEQAGWNIKSFTIPPPPYRFWHCIGAASLRLSVGFRYNLPDTI